MTFERSVSPTFGTRESVRFIFLTPKTNGRSWTMRGRGIGRRNEQHSSNHGKRGAREGMLFEINPMSLRGVQPTDFQNAMPSSLWLNTKIWHFSIPARCRA
jgi:hypothetical protein